MTTMHTRPSLQEMVKSAMDGTARALSVNIEASRQSSTQRGSTKTASKVDGNRVSTEMVSKLASALGFIEQELLKEAEGPGEGPGALTVTESALGGGPILSGGDSGQASSSNQPPMNPALQPDKAQEGNAGTGLATNDDMQHPAQPVEPIKNASAKDMLKNLGSKAIAGVKDVAHKANKAGGPVKDFAKDHKNGLGAAALGATAGGAGYAAGRLHAVAKGHEKKGSAPLALLRKLAEDAINPAHIESPASVNPAEPPPGASASGEDVPSEPSDVSSQKSMISSNEAAINYTKGQAKADPKKDVAQVLVEAPLSSATDKVLQEAFAHTSDAGVKISSAKGAIQKTASQVGAQRAMLDRLLTKAAADVAVADKDKKSMGMAPSTPQAATGVSAATMGQ